MSPTSSSGSFEVSVVMPFRNAEKTIGDQLEALATQDFAGAWEVVAVDNRSEDASRRIAESFSGRLELRVVDAGERLGAGYASNVGVEHAAADKLLFVDADDEVAPSYVSNMVAALDGHDFVTGALDHKTLNPDWVRAAHRFHRRGRESAAAPFGVLPIAAAAMGIKRGVFESVGGFPDDLPRMYDIALSWEAQFAGTPLHYVSEAVYYVRYRDNLRDLFRQGLAGSTCAPLLYQRYRGVGMQRRTVPRMLRSWVRLAADFSMARSRADLAPLMVRLGRELGRLRGSLRYRVFYP
jgi:glycosyltransferase involved in cell wall biosynthesis